jgi:gamma-glutamyl-gamma-aminobutyrate hydrolase PuuD
MKKKVKIIGDKPDEEVAQMFSESGWDVVKASDKLDLVCFTGGEDVTPFLYGENPIKIDGHDVVQFNPARDMYEIKEYHKHVSIPKVGICRGGQFLNVMSGGRMWQHVNHHGGQHSLHYISRYEKEPGDKVKAKPVWTTCMATSTHHQMMIPGDLGTVVGKAGLSTVKYAEDKEVSVPDPAKFMLDVEVVSYWHNNTLCFQPHPEYTPKGSKLREVFFDMISVHLGVR